MTGCGGRLRARGVLTAMLLMGACFVAACTNSPMRNTDGDTDGDGILDSVDRCPTQPETRNGVFDKDGCPDQPVDLYLAVRSDVETFWNLYFNTVLFRPYVPTARLQLFGAPGVSTACGNAPIGAGPFYCGFDGVIYLDEPFMTNQLNRFGDFADAVIIAHEIGHHTQNLLGLLNTISIQKELQADCLAGAWAASAGARGLVDAGDFQEAAGSLFAAADPAGTPWFAPNAHGTPAQRQQAFSTGFLRGAPSCN